MDVDVKWLPTHDRKLSSPCFSTAKVFQECANKCPDIFGPEKELHPLFYEAKAAKEKKEHHAKLLAAMMQVYRHLFDKIKPPTWD